MKIKLQFDAAYTARAERNWALVRRKNVSRVSRKKISEKKRKEKTRRGEEGEAAA
jgi:hypothetical protein